jgi:hypothetical protein
MGQRVCFHVALGDVYEGAAYDILGLVVTAIPRLSGFVLHCRHRHLSLQELLRDWVRG